MRGNQGILNPRIKLAYQISTITREFRKVTSRRLIPILGTVILLAVLSVPFLPTSESGRTSKTYTTIFASTIETTQVTRQSWAASECTNSRCPYIEKSSAALIGYSTLALDVTLVNPTALLVHNLAVRFNYWGPYACPSCAPEYTTLITFESFPPGTRQSKHVEVQNTQLFRQAIFRFQFKIETFQNSVWATFTATAFRTSVTGFTSTGFMAVYELFHPTDPIESVGILGAAGVLAFVCMTLLSRQQALKTPRKSAPLERSAQVTQGPTKPLSKSQTSNAGDISTALNPEFRIYRDRLQELLFAGRIDEKEYARLLAEFYKTKKK